MGCAHRMATQSFEIILQGIWDVPTVWPSTLVQRLQGIWDGPTVWPSTLAPNCQVSGMSPPCGHPPLLDIFTRDVVCTLCMAIHPCWMLEKPSADFKITSISYPTNSSYILQILQITVWHATPMQSKQKRLAITASACLIRVG